MANKNPTMGEAMPKTRPEKPVEEEEELFNAKATPKRQGKRGHTVYVDPAAHEAIKRVAKARKLILEQLWIEGMNYVLANHGEKPIA